MFEEDVASLKQHILSVAELIQPNLQPLPGRVARNAYAHIYGMIKALCGESYSKADIVKAYATVEAIRLSPNGTQSEILNLAKQIRRAYLDTKNSQHPDS